MFTGALQGPGDFLGGVSLDEVADLDASDALDRQAALEAGEHLPHVVLEPFERGDRALSEHGGLAPDPRAGAAHDLALLAVAAEDRPDLRDRDDLPHLGA